MKYCTSAMTMNLKQPTYLHQNSAKIKKKKKLPNTHWKMRNNKSRITRTLPNLVSDMPKSSFRELINCAYGMVMALQVTCTFLINQLELRIHSAYPLLSSTGLFLFSTTLYAHRCLRSMLCKARRQGTYVPNNKIH